MIPSHSQLRPCRQRAHLRRGGAASYIPQTKLSTEFVPPPRPQRAIGFESKRKLTACRYGRPRRQCAHLHGQGAIDSIAKSEVAGAVAPPRPQCTVGFGGDGVRASPRNLRPRRKRPDLDGRGAARVISFSLVAETELTVMILAPYPQCTVGFGGDGVRASPRNLRPRRKRPHLHGGGAVDYITETELAVVVPPPRPQSLRCGGRYHALGAFAHQLLEEHTEKPRLPRGIV